MFRHVICRQTVKFQLRLWKDGAFLRRGNFRNKAAAR
jgi:hypothetical protein